MQAEVCPTCKGTQWVVELVNGGNAEVTERCPTCKGNGFVYPKAKKTAPLSVRPAAGK